MPQHVFLRFSVALVVVVIVAYHSGCVSMSRPVSLPQCELATCGYMRSLLKVGMYSASIVLHGTNRCTVRRTIRSAHVIGVTARVERQGKASSTDVRIASLERKCNVARNLRQLANDKCFFVLLCIDDVWTLVILEDCLRESRVLLDFLLQDWTDWWLEKGPLVLTLAPRSVNNRVSSRRPW